MLIITFFLSRTFTTLIGETIFPCWVFTVINPLDFRATVGAKTESEWDLNLSDIAKIVRHKRPAREGLAAIRAGVADPLGRAIKGAGGAVNQIGQAIEERTALAAFDCSGNLQQIDCCREQVALRRLLVVHLLTALTQSRCYLAAFLVGNRLSSASILTAGAARTLLVFLARTVFEASNAESVELADAAVEPGTRRAGLFVSVVSH